MSDFIDCMMIEELKRKLKEDRDKNRSVEIHTFETSHCDDISTGDDQ